MDHYPRPLNPHAPPFYPSKPHRFRRPIRRQPPQPATKKDVHCPLPPVSRGPRIRNIRDHVIPLNPDERSTSVMIRNIPNNYTRSLLVEFLEEHCRVENEKDGNTIRSAFDFVYLPVDFKNRLNAGYAFVNFTTCEAAWRFHTCVTGKHWRLFQSKKIADVTRARIQGKDGLVRNFERMRLCSPSSEYLPVWFEPPRDGCMSGSTMKMHTIGEVDASRLV